MTSYARNGDVHIAYQVLGEGPIDLVMVPPFVSHLTLAWEQPDQARFLRRLSSFSRLILFDKRGTGLSDRRGGVAPLEERIDDLLAVLDAVGSERAAIFGASEGGAMSVLFAATYPDRTSALVLYGAYPATLADDDYPDGASREAATEIIDAWLQTWGQGASCSIFAPSKLSDPRFVEWMGRFEMAAASPGEVREIMTMILDIDVRTALPLIQAPTLVIYRTHEFIGHVIGSRYLAEHIPGARFLELPGTDYYPFLDDQDSIVDEVSRFLTGASERVENDRVLATVLITDIVGSTERSAQLGDAKWTALLDQHDQLVGKQIDRFRGRLVKSTGDGVLAVFDGPARAIRCARAVADEVGVLGIEVRAGLHTGEVEIRGDDIAGIAVHISARVAALAAPGEVLVSGAVPPLVVGSGLCFDERGTRELKGVPGEWNLFAVAG